MRDRWTCAVAGSTIRRALASALVVGPILIAINHVDAIVHGDLSAGRIFQMLLMFAVPYAVSTVSTVQAELGRRRDDGAIAAPGHSAALKTRTPR